MPNDNIEVNIVLNAKFSQKCWFKTYHFEDQDISALKTMHMFMKDFELFAIKFCFEAMGSY